MKQLLRPIAGLGLLVALSMTVAIGHALSAPPPQNVVLENHVVNGDLASFFDRVEAFTLQAKFLMPPSPVSIGTETTVIQPKHADPTSARNKVRHSRPAREWW